MKIANTALSALLLVQYSALAAGHDAQDGVSSEPSRRLLARTYDEFLAASGGQPMIRKDYSRRIYFAVEVPQSNLDELFEVHSADGWRYEEPLGYLPDHYVFSVEKGSIAESLLENIESGHGLDPLDDRTGRHASSHHYKRSIVAKGARSLQLLPVKKLYKRAAVGYWDSPEEQWDTVRVPRGRTTRDDAAEEAAASLLDALKEASAEQEGGDPPQQVPGDSAFESIEAVRKDLGIADPMFGDQWHLVNPLQPGNDLNISDVWRDGVTGKGVHVAVVDDGLDMDHADLKDNFYGKGSWDFNDNTALPKPRLSDDQHGTRCAGEIAAVRNDKCGVGVAYEAGIAGLRILSGDISEAEEALALNYAMNDNDIYSCSWGPPDNGEAMDEPGPLVKKALINGISNGRNKRGSIFVFASGNGAYQGDNCNFDGYTNSIYSITVAAVDRNNLQPFYSESCSANMVVTYSSNARDHISTTDVHGKCTDKHGGTSAAAPIAAGVFALALQVRPELTWRDLQYLCVNTAVQVNPGDPSWQQTAIGGYYSHDFGYGKLDAHRLVERAKTWDLVKPQAWYWSDRQQVNQAVTFGGGATESVITVTKENLEAANLERIEHVNVLINMSLEHRGAVKVELESPAGIVSTLAEPRRRDDSDAGFKNWTFMSVAHWGESGVGDWKLRVINDEVISRGELEDWTLKLWGEAIDADKAEPFPLDGIKDGAKPSSVPSVSAPADQSTATSDSPAATSTADNDEATTTTTATSITASEPTTTSPSPAEDEKPPPSSATTSATASASATASPWLWSMIPTFGFSPHTVAWIYGSALLIVAFVVGMCVYLFWYRRRRAGFDPLKQDEIQDGYEFDLVPPESYLDDEENRSHGDIGGVLDSDGDDEDGATAVSHDPRPVSAGKRARTLYADTPPPMQASVETTEPEELFQVDDDSDTDTTKNGDDREGLLGNRH